MNITHAQRNDWFTTMMITYVFTVLPETVFSGSRLRPKVTFGPFYRSKNIAFSAYLTEVVLRYSQKTFSNIRKMNCRENGELYRERNLHEIDVGNLFMTPKSNGARTHLTFSLPYINETNKTDAINV